jgi:hypothetical protein
VSVAASSLAQRLGCAVHVSILRRKLIRCWRKSPGNAESVEEWLVDLANARCATVIRRSTAGANDSFPSPQELSNEELVIGILLPQNLDHRQILRLAAQLISRESVEFAELRRLGKQERVKRILAALAKQALKIAPAHLLWQQIAEAFGNTTPLRSPLLQYTRMAEPVPENGRVCRGRWSLVT